MGNCELIYRAEQDNQSELFNWEFSVSYSGYDSEQQRHFYDWMVSCEGLADDGKSLETPVLCCSYPEDSARLGSGCSSEDNPESLSRMLGSLFSFLSAW